MKIKDFIDYEQPSKYIVDSDIYDDNGTTPVLTAGQSFILGYTNETNNIFTDIPVIIFDDFTTSVQYVDFPFKVKSSAMKILRSNNKANLKYCYYLLKLISKMPPNHKRQWISATSELEYDLPDLDKQNSVVKIIDKILDLIRSKNKQINLLDEAAKSRFIELFGDPITNSKNIETEDLKDVLMLKAGDFTSASDISDEPTETHIYPCYGGNGIRGYVSEYNQNGNYSLIGRQGALSGNVQYAKGQFKNTEHALLVTPLIEMNSMWLFYLLLMMDLKRYQTGAAQPGLSVKNLQEIKILIPSLELQNQFAEFVEKVDKSKLVIQQSLHETQKLFDSLMQEYFG